MSNIRAPYVQEMDQNLKPDHAGKDRPGKDRPGKDRPKSGWPGKNGAAKTSGKSRAKTDRRVLRTRNTLGGALVALMQEKNFAQITVQEVLDRAGVGRSTFYTHYRDKDDLFMSDVEDFLEAVAGSLKRSRDRSNRLLPVREFLSHVRDVKPLYAALTKSEKLSDLMVLARGIFARSIEERLQSLDIKIEPARAYALAGSFLSLLEWWVDKGMKADPNQMDETFHRMAWDGLTA
jgi:AcrR family transcriptional regulator